MTNISIEYALTLFHPTVVNNITKSHPKHLSRYGPQAFCSDFTACPPPHTSLCPPPLTSIPVIPLPFPSLPSFLNQSRPLPNTHPPISQRQQWTLSPPSNTKNTSKKTSSHTHKHTSTPRPFPIFKHHSEHPNLQVFYASIYTPTETWAVITSYQDKLYTAHVVVLEAGSRRIMMRAKGERKVDKALECCCKG
jgi:hypothetical protein